jgi:hypothetical protein
MRDLGEHGLARLARRRARVCREVREKSTPEQGEDVLETPGSGDLVDRVAADQQPTGVAVNLRQHRLGGDNAF